MNDELSRATEKLTAALNDIEDGIASGAAQPRDVVPRLESAIRDTCTVCAATTAPDPERDKLKRALRESISPWFSRSWFMDRAFKKPRGHPGDYETLEAIYDNRPRSEGIGEALDLYFLQTALARAVRGRKDWIRGFLVRFLSHNTLRPRILDIACGPSREIRELGRNGPWLFRLHALDFDQAALDFTKAGLQAAGVQLDELALLKQNVLRLTSGPRNVKQFGLFDLIYSVGLYDYLPDDTLV